MPPDMTSGGSRELRRITESTYQQSLHTAKSLECFFICTVHMDMTGFWSGDSIIPNNSSGIRYMQFTLQCIRVSMVSGEGNHRVTMDDFEAPAYIGLSRSSWL
jgi:hypothetical protein